MFCRNCGIELKENHLFCGNCGAKSSAAESGTYETAETSHSQKNNEGRPENNSYDFGIAKNASIKFIKTYLSKPASFFEEAKTHEKDLIKISSIILAFSSILYGIINIFYTQVIINSTVSFIKNLPNLLSKLGIISQFEASTAMLNKSYSDEITQYKNYLQNLVDNKTIFINSVIFLVVLVSVTTLVIFILNKTALKDKLEFSHIFFLSTTSYIPLVLAALVSIIASFLSVFFGCFIVLLGYILSFITLYNGILEFSEESKDRTFVLLAVIFTLISAILSIILIKYIESSLNDLIKNTKEIMNNWGSLF